MEAQILFWLAPLGAVLALTFGYFFRQSVESADPGSEKNQQVGGLLRDSMQAFLSTQVRLAILLFIGLAVLLLVLAFLIRSISPWICFAFLTGGIFTLLIAQWGSNTAVLAGGRAAAALSKSLSQGLTLALRGAALIGLVGAAFAIIDISIWWKVLDFVRTKADSLKESPFMITNYSILTTVMLASALGGSLMSLLFRLSGVLLSRGTSLGLEMTAKLEASIPEGDVRNPSVVADQVGYIAANTAAPGIEGFESLGLAVLAAAAIAASAFNLPNLEKEMMGAILLPVILAGLGLIFSVVSIVMISVRDDAAAKDVWAGFIKGDYVGLILTALVAAFLSFYLLPVHFKVYGSFLIGLLAGVIMGWAMETAASTEFETVKDLSKTATAGSSVLLTEGFALALRTSGAPMFVLGAVAILAYLFAGGFDHPGLGFYGIALAAVGMLMNQAVMTAGSSLAGVVRIASFHVDAAQIGADAKKRSDSLDQVGRLLGTFGRGYSIGASCMVVLALVGGYLEQLRSSFPRLEAFNGREIDKFIFLEKQRPVAAELANFRDLVTAFDINLASPQVLIGLFLGAGLILVLGSSLLRSISAVAQRLVEVVKAQYKEVAGLVKGEPGVTPQHAVCMKALMQEVHREALWPVALVAIMPAVASLVFGPGGLLGLLMGALIGAVGLGLLSSGLSGGWEASRMIIESGQHGGKGTDAHKATILTDQLGQGLREACGPVLVGVIKPMAMVGVVLASFTVIWGGDFQNLLNFPAWEWKNRVEANELHKGGLLKLPDIKAERAAAAMQDGVIDDEDALMVSDEGLLPEDEEGMMIEEYASGTASEAFPGTIAPPPPAAGAASTTPETGLGGGFDGFEGGDKPADKPGDKPATKPETGTGESFGGFDDAGDKPADSGKPGNKPAGGFDTFDEPAGAKPGDKPADVKPADKPADAKPADKPADAKPADKPADAKPADKPADDKPADKPADAKPADKPADDKPADKPADAKPADKPADAKPADKPADAKPADKPAAGGGGFDDF